LQWYAEQIALDNKEDFESKRDFVEYMASFWNSEAVRSIKESRASKEQHNFAKDKEFEEQLVKQDYKNNKYVQAIMELRKKNNTNNSQEGDVTEKNSFGHLPKDLKFLKDY